MKMIRVLTAAVAILSLAGTTVVAQGKLNVRKACAADMQKLCPGIDDRHAAHKCMRTHLAEVSPDCHSAMMAAKAAHDARKAQAAPAEAPMAAPTAAPPPATPH